MTVARDRPPSVPVAVSVLLADLVDGPDRPLEVLAAFPAAVYLVDRDDPGRTVAVVARDAAVPPAAVVLPRDRSRAGLVGLARDAAAGVGAGVLRLGPVRFAPSRWFDPRPRPPAGADPAAGARRLEGMLDAATEPAVPASHRHVADAVAGRVAALRDALDRRDPAAAAAAGRHLVGVGPGLTPAGDDVLAGLLATSAVLARAAVAPRPRPELDAVLTAVLEVASVRTTLLSSSLLRDAAAGAMTSPATRLLSGLLAPVDRWDPVGARIALAGLLAVGASSGRDLAEGMLLALRCAADSAAGPDAPRVPASPDHRPSDAPALVATDPWSPR